MNWNQRSWSPPVLTRTWFHTGAFGQAGAVSQQYMSEYWTEPALRAPGQAHAAAAMRLPDTVLPDGLDAYEAQEAYRALKGHALRIETYAQDGYAAAGNPYTVTEQNFTVRLVQPQGPNLHAVFFVHPREALTSHYERGAADPRVSHELTLETDAYGNVLRSISVGYPRRPGYPPPEPTLPAAARAMLAYDQARLHVRGTEQGYTNPVDDPDAYRVPLTCTVDSAEITGVAPPVRAAGITNLFTFGDIDGSGGVWSTVWAPAADIGYEQVPASDIDGTGVPAAAPTRRFVARQRVRYRADDLSAVLGPGGLQPRGLPGESYQAALTPGMVSAIFGSLVPAATLTAAGFVQLAGETGWWIPSGRVYYSPGDGDTPAVELAQAMISFFLPFRAVDPLGAITRAGYDGHWLLPATATDAVGNVTSAVNDYRVVLPATVTDSNENRVSLAFDVFGRVTATAMMGKATEAVGDELTGFSPDLDEAALAAVFADPTSDPAAVLGNATTRILYDTGAFQRTSGTAQPSPVAVCMLARETHVSDLAGPTSYQYRFVYADGFGREIQRTARAAPDPVSGAARWATSGWRIYDNKSRPVRSYEPFFSTANAFEFGAAPGVATVTLYDPVGRVVATLHPDNSWEKTTVGPWLEQKWDGDDTVLVTDPRSDTDVGDYFTRLLGTTAFTSWYDLRIGGQDGSTPEEQAAQQDAARKTAPFAATPATTHRDSADRACLAVADNGPGVRYPVRTAYDTEGKPLAVVDELGRRAEENCYRSPDPGGGFTYIAGTDMAGLAYRVSADGGARRTLLDVTGQAIRTWDARGHAFRLVYDPARRLTHRYVSTDGAPEILLNLNVYGEGQQAANLRGRLFRGYDGAGYQENTQYDFKGNLAAGARQLAADHHATVNWTPLASLTTAADLDAAAAAAGLVPTGDGGRDRFANSTRYDALNRPVQQVAPHNPAMLPDVVQPRYDEAGLLRQVDVWLQQAAAPAQLLDPATADRHAVTGIGYNARGQRISIGYGNGTTAAHGYDPQTFRLTSLTTTRPGSFTAAQQTVQGLSYFYDPVGNVTATRDDADTQNMIFFSNQRVEPSASYNYDATYRLIAATGREHLGQTGGAVLPPNQVTNDDSFRMGLPQPGDGTAMGTYTENYAYDAAGNLLSMGHVVSSGNWTRRYAYAEASQITAAETGNRLTATSLPGDPAGGPYSATYAHDAHGNMTRMPHLSAMTWDEDDRLRSTSPNVGGTPQVTWYAYDTSGQRVRKATDQPGTIVLKSERIYLGAIEIYRTYGTDGTLSMERETLHVSDGDHAVALAENRTTGTDNGPAALFRYQHSNHLGSAVLELDDNANIITYEEYFPFGSTSYQAVDSQTETPKRYRYTGKERDEENNLYYLGARYYATWLGRWTSCDPEGLADGNCPYSYARSNPVAYSDPSGHLTWGQIGVIAVVVVAAVAVTTLTAGAGGVLVAAAIEGAELTGAAATAASAAGTIAVGAASGAAGSVTASAVGQELTTGHIESGQLKDAAISGTLSGAATAGLGQIAASGALGVRAATIARSTATATRAARGAVAGGIGGATYETARQVVSGQHAKAGGFNAGHIAESTLTGATFGAVFETALPAAARLRPVPAQESPPASAQGAPAAQAKGGFVGSSTRQMRRVGARLLRESTDPVTAGLRKNLLDAAGKFKTSRGLSHDQLIDRPDVLEMGHVVSDKAGGERVVLQSAWLNQFDRVTVEAFQGRFVQNEAVTVGPVAIEARTASWFEDLGWLPPGTVDNAPKIK